MVPVESDTTFSLGKGSKCSWRPVWPYHKDPLDPIIRDGVVLLVGRLGLAETRKWRICGGFEMPS